MNGNITIKGPDRALDGEQLRAHVVKNPCKSYLVKLTLLFVLGAAYNDGEVNTYCD